MLSIIELSPITMSESSESVSRCVKWLYLNLLYLFVCLFVHFSLICVSLSVSLFSSALFLSDNCEDVHDVQRGTGLWWSSAVIQFSHKRNTKSRFCLIYSENSDKTRNCFFAIAWCYWWRKTAAHLRLWFCFAVWYITVSLLKYCVFYL